MKEYERVYFVGGIDTGIGKTVATGFLARSLIEKGIDATTFKLVQTGCEGVSEDIEVHRRICGVPLSDEDKAGITCPQIFRFPSSPELAARLEGKTVDLDRITECVAECSRRHRVVLVEAAGGLAVPLTKEVLTIDFVARQGWPVILVTCGRLGSINHTLLSLEAIFARKIPLAAVVMNWCENLDPVIEHDTEETLKAYLAARTASCPSVPIIRIPALP